MTPLLHLKALKYMLETDAHFVQRLHEVNRDGTSTRYFEILLKPENSNCSLPNFIEICLSGLHNVGSEKDSAKWPPLSVNINISVMKLQPFSMALTFYLN